MNARHDGDCVVIDDLQIDYFDAREFRSCAGLVRGDDFLLRECGLAVLCEQNRVIGQ